LKNKNPNALMPQEFGIYTARRYFCLYNQGSAEDVFPYHNPQASWKELKSVRQPLAVIVGSRDEYFDRPSEKLVEIFQKNAVSAKAFSGMIIKGANHGFHKKEKEVSKEIIKFIQRAVV
jgi:alpha/beta superfamily hydrolase